jgi:hypothetical protein
MALHGWLTFIIVNHVFDTGQTQMVAALEFDWSSAKFQTDGTQPSFKDVRVFQV